VSETTKRTPPPEEDEVHEAEGDATLDGEVLGENDADEPEGSGEDDSPFLPLAQRGGVLVKRDLLSRYVDLLSRYVAEVRRFERLDADEEHRLAVRWHEQGDVEAAQRLVTSHLRLVVAIALSFRRAFANVLDLIQEGNLGLMEAVERFDPYQGTRLSTYATWWIRSRIVRYLLDNWRLVRVGTTNARRKLLYNLRAERQRLEAKGITPTTKLLADNLGASEEDVVAVDQALGAGDVSLDAPLGENGTATGQDLLAAAGRSPEAEVDEALLVEKLHGALDELLPALSERERAILRERLLADEPVTLQDLADRDGVSREAVRQTEQRLLAKLQAHLEERLPEAAGWSLRPRAE
jgi:RNA polymerase sigma-32 factor